MQGHTDDDAQKHPRSPALLLRTQPHLHAVRTVCQFEVEAISHDQRWSPSLLLQAWRVSEKLGLIGPACEQPEYNIFARKKVEVEFKPIYEK